MRVLLVWPNSKNEVLGWGDLGAVAEPLALEYLGAAIRSAGGEPRILDLRLHPNALIETLEEFEPQLVGVTAYSMHVRRAVEICAEVKAWRSTCMTIVGGHHATFLPEDFFEPWIDYVAVGEGTPIVEELVRAFPESPAPTPNLWRRVGERHALDETGETLNRAALRDMPAPDRSLTRQDRHRYFIDWMRPVALLRTTVGCPYRCTFCSIWKAVDGHYLIQDESKVLEELATLEERWVFLIDDEAFINGKRMIRLAEAIGRAGIDRKYFTYCRIDTLLRNSDAVRAWRDIGLRRLFIGIDAISPKDLEEYNKSCSIDQIEAGLQLADELGIEVFAQFVVNTDYDRSDFKRLSRFIEHHRIQYPSFTVLTPLPGTDLLPNFEKVLAVQPNGRPDWALFDCQNAVTKTRLAPEQFRREYRNLYHVFKGAYVEYREQKAFVTDTETPLLGGRVFVTNKMDIL